MCCWSCVRSDGCAVRGLEAARSQNFDCFDTGKLDILYEFLRS